MYYKSIFKYYFILYVFIASLASAPRATIDNEFANYDNLDQEMYDVDKMQ